MRRAEKRIDPVPNLTPPLPENLTEEETALLERYTREGLPRVAAEAMNLAQTGRPAEAAEAHRRYTAILNLIAKVDPPPEAVSPEIQERQKAYSEALPAEEARLADLPEADRERELSLFKYAFFEDLLKNQPTANAGATPNGAR